MSKERPEGGSPLPSQVADYEITSSVLEDGTTPCLRARRPARLGGGEEPVTIWIWAPGANALDGGQGEARTRRRRAGGQPAGMA